jgi:hypothetical protein
VGAARAGTTVDADLIVLRDGSVAAEGHVVLVAPGGARVTADAASLVDGVAHLRWGATVIDGLEVVFTEGEADLAAGTFVLYDVRVAAIDGTLRAAAERLVVDGSGALTGEGLIVTTCDCAVPSPWQVRARRAVLRDDVVRVHGASLDVLEVPVLPLPFAEMPLSRRSGLLLPEAAWTQDGPSIGLPVYVTLGRSADVTITPEWRAERGPRLGAEGRWSTVGGAGQAEVFGGWDTQTTSARGSATWAHAAHRGATRLATEGQAASDLGYFADYGQALLVRGTPWGEARALVGWRELELTTDLFQASSPTTQTLAALTSRAPTTRLPGGVLVDGVASGAIVGAATDPWSVDDADAIGLVGGRVARPTFAGPARVTPSVAAEAVAAPGANVAAATGAVDAALAGWRSVGDGQERLEPGVSASVSAALRDGVTPPEPWSVGPTLLWRRVGAGWVELQAAAPTTPSGTAISGDAAADAGDWSFAAQSDVRVTGATPGLELANAKIGWRPGVWRTALSWIYADEQAIRQPDPDDARDLHQARGGLGVQLGDAVSLDGVLTWDLDGMAPVTRELGASWTHPTGCLTIGATAALSADRPLPDVRLEVSAGRAR